MIKNNGFHNRHSPFDQPFNPASFFANGEQGWVYDPSNMATLFQDSAGTTPVTAMEQPVGLQLDLSGRNNHRFQATNANRPVVSARVNLFVGTSTLATQSITTRATTYTLTFTGSGSITLTGTAIGVYTAGTYSVTTTAGSLTATVLGAVNNADMRETNAGVGLPAYQQVVTSTSYDTVGFPVYIKPNGTSQFMLTNSIDFRATNKMTAWQGLRSLTGGVYGALLELSSDAEGNNGTFFMSGNGDLSIYRVAAGSRGTVTSFVFTNSTAYNPPLNLVQTLIADIPGDVATLRLNGVQAASSASNQGTGNFGNFPAYFYARGGTILRFNGHDYGSIVRGAASTADQITSGENWINQRTRAY